jgi:hypothetical protein
MSSQAAAAAVPRRRNTAALVWHQVRYEQLSFWRNPQSAFFLFATGPPSSSRWSSARPRSALGVAVASLISNAEAAPAVVQFVFFPLVFISGTYFQITSRFLNDLAGVFPVRPFNQALLNPFALDRGFAGRQLLVLAIWGIAGGFVAIRRFRWDPRPE